MKNYSDLISISGGLLAVASVILCSVLSMFPAVSSDLLALLFVGGLFSGFIICLSGFWLAEMGKQSKATDYAA